MVMAEFLNARGQVIPLPGVFWNHLTGHLCVRCFSLCAESSPHFARMLFTRLHGGLVGIMRAGDQSYCGGVVELQQMG
jgi:hypothetical protein